MKFLLDLLILIKGNLLWTQGQKLLMIIVGLGCAGYLFSTYLIVLSFLLFFFCFYFFRNPERVCLLARHDKHLIVCPADGKVVAIEAVNDPIFSQKIAIFLSPFDVHVNWVPMASTVTDVVYHKGKFAFAFLPKSSELNERNDLVIITHAGIPLKIRQIAGTIARVIECWVKPGDHLVLGQKYGMIKFGSRIELFIPKNVTIMVQVGQRVYGGQTVVARI